MRDFYQTYYVPANATLTLVGDFETAQAKQLVEQYLGRVPKAERPVPRDIPKEPPQTEGAPRHGRSSRGRCRRSSWRTTSPTTAIPIRIRCTSPSKVLSDGQSSRIYQKLVYDKQLAVAAFGGANLIEDPNLFYAVAIVQPGRKPEDAINALIAELDRLKSEPITDRELQRTKNQFARDYILEPRVEPAEGACTWRTPR